MQNELQVASIGLSSLFMTCSRRSFLLTTAAATLAPSWGIASLKRLTAEPVIAQILEGEFSSYGQTPSLGFNGSTPGPLLTVRQGEELAITFQNRTGAPSTVHWHGIRIANAMDGVPGLTQSAVPDGEDFEYRFVAPDAGTFWYHAHSRSWEQVARGLYGPLIVEEPTPPDVDADITVIVNDWRLGENAAFIDDFDAMFHFAHAGRMGNYAKIIPSQTTVRRGDRVRLRLINTANARVFPIDIRGITGKVVALDGMPLEQAQEIGTITMAPAQRADIICDVVDTIAFSFWTGQDDYALGEIATVGANPAPRNSEIPPLPANGIPKPDKAPDRRELLLMQGGAMGGQHPGEDIWSLNGVSDLPEEPWLKVKRGTSVQITLENDTSFPHGIHLHGQHFFEVNKDESLGPLRDTSLVQARESRDILCVFDNPGKWLLHCHMLEHAASGMKTWVEVT
ncbi:MAG: multicopper oxidase family protein [Arenibacterium sp.]